MQGSHISDTVSRIVNLLKPKFAIMHACGAAANTLKS